MISEELKIRLCRYINTYIFQTIWNEPYKEYRRNIIPKLLYPRPKISTFECCDTTFFLPDNTTNYYVYSIPLYFYGGIDVKLDEWKTAEEYLNSNDLLIKVHGKHGEWLHRNKIYIKKDKHHDLLLIAIDYNHFKRVLGAGYDPKEIYTAPYFDSDIVNPVTIHCYNPQSQVEINNIYNEGINATTVFINGREVVLQSVNDIQIGDDVEILIDENVIGAFNVDLALQNPNRVFTSEIDGREKYIVHIPKDLNPNQCIISHHTCDVYIRPRNLPNHHLKGLFLHRCQGRGNSFTQLTHQDFAIPMYIINDFCSALGEDEVTLHVIVRTHHKGNTLIRDKNYIDMLYLHNTDDEILDMLEGRGPVDLDFWRAPHLEQSEFVKMLEDVPNVIVPSNVHQYVEALGYYHVLSLVCERVKKYTISESFTRRFKVDIPLVFGSERCTPLIFINGKKLRYDEYYYTYSVAGYIMITIHDDVTINVGDEMVIELFEDPNKPIRKFTPVNGDDTISLDYRDFEIYLEQDESSDPIKGIFIQSDKSYRKIDNPESIATITETETGVDIQFASTQYDKSFIIQHTKHFFKQHYELTPITDPNDPLVITLKDGVLNEIEDVPTLGMTGFLVYLNGRELVENTDFKVYHINNWHGDESIVQVVIHNMSYLQEFNNYVEVVACKDEMRFVSNGFCTNDSINEIENLPFFYDTLSMISTDGYTVKDVEIVAGKLIVVNRPPRVGAIYQVRTVIPDPAKEFIDEYHVDDDSARYVLIRNYYSSYDAPEEELLLLPYSHRIYSLFLHTVIRDVINGTLFLGYDPEPESMLLQLEDYKYLMDYDLVIIRKDEFDLRFLDLFPTYQDRGIETVECYRAVQQLIQYILPDDNISDGDYVRIVT